MPTINVGNLENQEAILQAASENKDLLLKVLSSVDSLQEFNWRQYWSLQRTGHVFTVRKYDHDVSTSTQLEKLDDNAGKVMIPATDTDPGRNDYANEPMFRYLRVNFTVDNDGYQHITAVEGDGKFAKDGTNGDVGVMYMPWFVRETRGDGYKDISVTDTPTEGFIPLKAAKDPDGTIAPFMLFAAYNDTGYGGKPSSVSGGKVKRMMSYSGNISWYRKLGTQYCSMTAGDLQFIQLQFMIKYGSTNSQSKMTGCTNYNIQKKCAVAEANVVRVILTTADASGYIVGSCVSVGEMGSNTNMDRGQSYMHNLADDVKILSIDDVEIDGTTYKALYLDITDPITTTLTACVSTMHWHTGATDSVLGPDGSPVSNTAWKYPCRIGGIELFLGGYDVIGNVVLDHVTTDGVTTIDVYICNDATLLSSNADTIRSTFTKVGQMANTKGAWKYITEMMDDYFNGMSIPTATGGGDSVGYADALITSGATSGMYEFLALGSLRGGGVCGLWCVNGYGALSLAGWLHLARLSPNGRRG